MAVEVDGRDVTADCEVRLPKLWPPGRADYGYRPAAGWAPGRHEVRVSWPEAADAARWSFEVERPGSGRGAA